VHAGDRLPLLAMREYSHGRRSRVFKITGMIVAALLVLPVLYVQWARSRVEHALGALGQGAPLIDGRALPAAAGSIVIYEGDTIASIHQIAGVRSEELAPDSMMLFFAVFHSLRGREIMRAESTVVAIAYHDAFWAGRTVVRLHRDSSRAGQDVLGRLFIDSPRVVIPVVAIRVLESERQARE
jgi:hypothetical protein